MPIKAVVYDTENVWWDGFSTELCLDRKKSVNPVIDGLKRNQYMTSTDERNFRDRMASYGLKTVRALGFLRELLGTPALGSAYSLEDHEKHQRKVQSRLAGISQSFIHEMDMKTIRKIAENVRLTDGIQDAVNGLREKEVYQIASSDGVVPFVYVVAERLGGVDHIEVPETIVKMNGKGMKFDPNMIYSNYISLQADFRGYHDRFENSIKETGQLGLKPSEILYVESSFPDFGMIDRVREEGSHVIAFHPVGYGRPLKTIYEKHGVPMIDNVGKRDAGIIFEIAMDPGKIERYCVNV